MKLIVGLGNIGKEYERTRHNIGFMCIDNYVSSKNIIINWKNKFDGLYTEIVINGEKVILLKPQLYMNLSGQVVKKYVDYYKINIDDILIISDDLDLNIGVYKLKLMGSCGGHNGLRNIEFNLNTNQYKRLKIGISNNKEIKTKDYVLGNISKSDMYVYENIFNVVNNIIDDFIVIDFVRLMSKYNGKNGEFL